MRLWLGFGKREGEDAPGFDGNNIVLILQNAFDKQKGMMNDDGVILRKKLRGDNRVGDAGFVFEAEEDKAFGCAWPLTGNDRAGNADLHAAALRLQLRRGQDAKLDEFGAMKSERVRANCQASALKIGDEAFFRGHGEERRREWRMRLA